MLWRKKLYEEVCQRRPFTQMKKAKYTDLRAVFQKQDYKRLDPTLEASHLWGTRKNISGSHVLQIKDGPSKDFRPNSRDLRTCYRTQGLCRCTRIKVFKTGRLPRTTWVAQCNNQGPCKRGNRDGTLKMEEGVTNQEMQAAWVSPSLQKAGLLTIWFSLVNQILDFWLPKLLRQ